MHIDYITACVDCVDFLEVSFRHNKSEFDRFTIVTTPRDLSTQRFCADNNLNCVITDAFYHHGAKFDRGFALNFGFLKIAADADWVVHMDADTFVPKDWRKKFPKLDKEFFYGARRVLLNTSEDYKDFLSGKKSENDFEIPLGIGYGFFQMFNWNSSVIRNTPINYPWYPPSPRGDACESDWMFRNMWGEHAPHDYTKNIGKLEELPFRVYHLGQHGQNHFGRKSEKFKV